MKKLALLIIFLFASSQVFAFGWFKSEEEEPEIVEETVVEETIIRHKALWYSGNLAGERQFILLRILEGDVVQVGIIDEKESKIYHVKDLKIVPGSFSWCDKIDGQKVCNEEEKLKYLDDKFPNITPLKFHTK